MDPDFVEALCNRCRVGGYGNGILHAMSTLTGYENELLESGADIRIIRAVHGLYERLDAEFLKSDYEYKSMVLKSRVEYSETHEEATA